MAEAEAIYRQILAIQPQNAETLHLLGVVAYRTGRIELAEELIGQAIALKPGFADAYNNLGVVLKETGQFDRAIAACRQAIAIDPQFPESHNSLGNALKEQGRWDEAMAAYRRAIALQPDFAGAHCNLGAILRTQGRSDEAIRALFQAIGFNPHLTDAHIHLGRALAAEGRFAEAIGGYRRAIALDPASGETFNSLGVALTRLSQFEEAVEAFRRAGALLPMSAEVAFNIGNSLMELGQLDEAIVALEQALVLKPDYAEAISDIASTLFLSGRQNEAMAAYRRAVAINPQYRQAHDNLVYLALFLPNYDVRVLGEDMSAWNRQYADPHVSLTHLRPKARDPNRRLRIGYVSPDFRRHVIRHFLVPLLEAHHREEVEIFCYASVRCPDEITQRIMKRADVWRDVLRVSDEALAGQIREDRIDILVDLTQHMADNRLPMFAYRPAPVQVAWLGYPGSTGLRAMDYRLTDAWMEPEGAAWAESVETPVRLPDSWFCFDPLEDYAEPGKQPALGAGHVTFGCLNNFCKVNEAVLERWRRVMQTVAGSHLLLQCPQGETQVRVRQWFEAHGIAAERLELIARTATREEFLKLFDRIDLALDPFPYNGGTTTCEMLWMGIPVLTLSGRVTVSRIGLSILQAAGMPEFIAETEEEYVSLAANLAADLPRLAQLRATLRGRMKASAFMDAPRFARGIEAAYREMWRRWCAEGG